MYLNVINKCNAETRITFAEKIQQEYFMTFTYSSFEFTYLSITLVFWTKNIVYKKENINQLHSAQFEIYWGKDFCGSAKQDNWKVSSLSSHT